MDFRLFFEQIKQLTDPAIFAIIAKFAIAFYSVKLLFKGFKELLKFIFAVKEKKDNYEESQKEFKEFKETFNKAMLKIEEDLSFLNAYRDIKHDKDEETVEARKTMKLILEKLTTNKL
jgi:hypothetical protein